MARWSLKEPLPDLDCVVLDSFRIPSFVVEYKYREDGPIGRYIIVTGGELPASWNDGFLI